MGHMTLTLDHGPFGPEPPAAVNYTLDGPAHKLLMTPFPRRVRAEIGGEIVLDSMRGMLLHETGILPRLYVPFEDVRDDLLHPTPTVTHCPFKGDAAYWLVEVGDRVVHDAFWAYLDPKPEARWLKGLVAPYWHKLDRWFDEDEEVLGHLRDPYHRVDCRQASRHVVVRAGGEVIAESDRPVVLSETGLPNRLYLPREDVRADVLEPTGKQTVCPYKGTAAYFRVRVGDTVVEDAAWSYEQPLESALKVARLVCFDDALVDVQTS
jgi:uncharacterized protein (DUF427 family)